MKLEIIDNKYFEENKKLFSNIRKMNNDDKLFISYNNKPTRQLKKIIRNDNNNYHKFVAQSVLDVRYNKKRKKM